MLQMLEAFIQPLFTAHLIPTVTVIGLVISSVWAGFFLLQDHKHPEPIKVILETFFLGILAAFSAIGAEKIFISFLQLNTTLSAYSLPSLVGNAFIEEFIKFAVVFVFISASKYFDEPVDRMIYMIVSGLGFAAAENIFFLTTAGSSSELLTIVILRFTGATLMHAVTSGTLGYYWAKKDIVVGIITATLIHFVFNVLILGFGPELYPVIFLCITTFILFRNFDRIKSRYHERKKHNKRRRIPEGR